MAASYTNHPTNSTVIRELGHADAAGGYDRAPFPRTRPTVIRNLGHADAAGGYDDDAEDYQQYLDAIPKKKATDDDDDDDDKPKPKPTHWAGKKLSDLAKQAEEQRLQHQLYLKDKKAAGAAVASATHLDVGGVHARPVQKRQVVAEKKRIQKAHTQQYDKAAFAGRVGKSHPMQRGSKTRLVPGKATHRVLQPTLGPLDIEISLPDLSFMNELLKNRLLHPRDRNRYLDVADDVGFLGRVLTAAERESTIRDINANLEAAWAVADTGNDDDDNDDDETERREARMKLRYIRLRIPELRLDRNRILGGYSGPGWEDDQLRLLLDTIQSYEKEEDALLRKWGDAMTPAERKEHDQAAKTGAKAVGTYRGARAGGGYHVPWL
jgi:hypothetical protein